MKDMNKSPTSGNPSPANATDQFWLACIAQQNRIAQSGATPEDAMAEGRMPMPGDVLYEAAVVDRGIRHGAWKIRDISTGGVFLEMDVTQLQEGAIVEFSLQYNYRGQLFDHRYPAKITRIQLNGAALRFGYYDDQIRSDLVSLLYGR